MNKKRMKKKMKAFAEELVTELVVVSVFLLVLSSFVLSFIFVDNYFFPCVIVGFLASGVTAALCIKEEDLCE